MKMDITWKAVFYFLGTFFVGLFLTGGITNLFVIVFIYSLIITYLLLKGDIYGDRKYRH